MKKNTNMLYDTFFIGNQSTLPILKNIVGIRGFNTENARETLTITREGYFVSNRGIVKFIISELTGKTTPVAAGESS